MSSSDLTAIRSVPDQFTVRKPAPEETGRVQHFFRKIILPAQARFLVAVKRRPVERFIAASVWWPEGTLARFRLACLPGLRDATRNEVAKTLVHSVEDDVLSSKIRALHYAELLGAENEMCQILQQNGFKLWRSERHFEVAGLDAWTRVMRMFDKYKNEFPADWRTDPIRLHAPEVVLNMVRDYRLMIPAELRNYWRTDSPLGFELDLSSVLFAGATPIGALLTRRIQDALCIDVRVVQLENRRLRALGNIALLHHIAARRDPGGPIKWLRFRAGEIEHRETANLAFRMGGRELPPRHVFAKTFDPVSLP